MFPLVCQVCQVVNIYFRIADMIYVYILMFTILKFKNYVLNTS